MLLSGNTYSFRDQDPEESRVEYYITEKDWQIKAVQGVASEEDLGIILIQILSSGPI